MNGTFHLIQTGGEEIWLDGEGIERITKYDAGEDTSHFYVKIEKTHKQPEEILGVAAIEFFPNTKEKKEL